MGLLNSHKHKNSLTFCSVTPVANRPPSRACPTSPAAPGDHIRTRRLDVNLLQRSIIGKGTGFSQTSTSSQRYPGFLATLLLPPTNITRSGKHQGRASMHGWSQKMLSRISGIDPPTPANWGRRKSKPGTLLKRGSARLLGSPEGCVLQRTLTRSGRGSLL